MTLRKINIVLLINLPISVKKKRPKYPRSPLLIFCLLSTFYGLLPRNVRTTTYACRYLMDFIPNEMCGMFWDKVLEYILISLIQSFTLDLSGFPHWNHLNSTRKNFDCCWVFSWWTIKRWWMNALNISARSFCLFSFA